MSTNDTMQIDPMVALQEAIAREAFLKDRTLFLGQCLAMQKAENQILLDKISRMEADLLLAGSGVHIDGETE